MKRKELLAAGYKLHHTGSRRGYVSRKTDPDELLAKPYKGRFGEGYTVNTPRYDTTQFVHVEYWIKN